MAELKPTVGRVLHYWPHPSEAITHDPVQPLAAMITHVNSPSEVNLVVYDANGFPQARQNIALRQVGDPVPGNPFCEWMPYQKAVARGDIEPARHAS